MKVLEQVLGLGLRVFGLGVWSKGLRVRVRVRVRVLVLRFRVLSVGFRVLV